MAQDELEGRYAEETRRLLTEAGAILEDDHFVYISGDHGSGWIDKDDIVNTGLSLRQTVEAVRGAGGTVVGTACLVSRGNVDAGGLGVDRFDFLLEYKIPAWPALACTLCQAGVPINTRHAHGAEFLAQQARQR